MTGRLEDIVWLCGRSLTWLIMVEVQFSCAGTGAGRALAGLPSWEAVFPEAGAGVGVNLAEATYATTTATITSGMTVTPSEPSSKVASRTEVSGSESIAAHIAPMPMATPGTSVSPNLATR